MNGPAEAIKPNLNGAATNAGLARPVREAHRPTVVSNHAALAGIVWGSGLHYFVNINWRVRAITLKLVRALAVRATRPIAIVAENLESSRIIIPLKPRENSAGIPQFFAVLSAVFIHMINCKEFDFFFAATRALGRVAGIAQESAHAKLSVISKGCFIATFSVAPFPRDRALDYARLAFCSIARRTVLAMITNVKLLYRFVFTTDFAYPRFHIRILS